MAKTGEQLETLPVTTATVNTEDDVTTTSTDSETFGTWTMVKNCLLKIDSKQRMEELQTDDDNEVNEDGDVNESFELKSSLDDSFMDDASDGISIISESESSGRLSPHPNLRQHLRDFKRNIIMGAESESQQFATEMLSATLSQGNDDCQIKHRRRKHSQTNTLQPLEDSDGNSFNLLMLWPFSPIVRKGLSTLLYVGILLGALGIVGRLYSPEWARSTSSSPSLGQLQLKFNDMELQNNLMRAEIDILTKQVNYLTKVKDENRRGDSKGYNIPSSTQYKGQKDKAYKQNAKFASDERFNKEHVNTFETVDNNIKVDEPEDLNKYSKEGYIKVPTQEDFNREERKAQENIKFQQRETFQKGENMPRSEEKWKKDYYMNKSFKPSSKGFPEKHFEKGKINTNHKNNRQFSHERRYHDDDSKFSDLLKKHEKNLEEFRERMHKYKYEDSGRSMKGKDSPREKRDGHWQEEYMKHRANERHINERKRNDNNWFIERGDSREQIRLR